jgi:hypothetical protein
MKTTQLERTKTKLKQINYELNKVLELLKSIL